MVWNPTSVRLDYIYENDVALDRLLTFLENTKDRDGQVKTNRNTITFHLR